MAEGKQSRFQIFNCFGFGRKPYYSECVKITAKTKRKYPVVAEILSCGYADKELLEAACKIYIRLPEGERNDLKWYGERQWNVVYFLSKDIIIPLPKRPLSPYWFWHATEAIRSKHPEKEIFLFFDEGSLHWVFCVLPFVEYSVHKFGDYKTLPPEEKLPMWDFLMKYENQIARPCWLDSAVRVGSSSKEKASVVE